MGNEMMSNFKVNRFISLFTLPSDSLTQSLRLPPTTDFIGFTFFHLHVVANWLTVAAPFFVGGALLLCIVCCCLPLVVSSVRWIFNRLCTPCQGVVNARSMACQSVGSLSSAGGCETMFAPTGEPSMISRAVFESNPAAYFRALRTQILR